MENQTTIASQSKDEVKIIRDILIEFKIHDPNMTLSTY